MPISTPPERWKLERDKNDPQVATATLRDGDATATVRMKACDDPPGYSIQWEAKRGGSSVGSGEAWGRGRSPVTIGIAAAEQALREAPQARVTEPVRTVAKPETAPREEAK